MKPINLILIGRSGSGKGTQAELLVEYLGNIHYVSSGQLFRNLSTQETDIGRRTKVIVEEGGLPPDELAIALWLHNIAYHVAPEQGIIFDGAPRKLDEARHLESILKFMDRFNDAKVLLIEISKDEAVKRLKLRARNDDNVETIKNRLDFYDEHVVKVVQYFESLDKLIKINGEQSIKAIFEEIKRKLDI